MGVLQVVAVARVLMMGRTKEAYLEVLNYFKILAPTFEPRRIHCDFERAMMSAFATVFPRSRIVGCLWHFAVVSILDMKATDMRLFLKVIS